MDAQPQLVDQTGRHFTLASLRGAPVVVTFIAAHCTDACPLIDAQFAQAAVRLRHDRVHVRLLTVTLDPEHDSQRDLRVLAQRFHANPNTWLIAGGSSADVHRVMSAFGAIAQQGRRGYADVHSTFVYFLDAAGRLRDTTLASNVLAAQIEQEAQR